MATSTTKNGERVAEILSVNISTTTRQRVDAVAGAKGISRGAVVRAALDEWLDRRKVPTPPEEDDG